MCHMAGNQDMAEAEAACSSHETTDVHNEHGLAVNRSQSVLRLPISTSTTAKGL